MNNIIKKKRKKFVLTLNSHSLSDFQRCNKIFEYSNIVKIQPTTQYYPFIKGALISKILELWYRAKRKKYSEKKLENLEFKLFKILWNHKDLKEYKLKDGTIKSDKHLLATRMEKYFNKYKQEEFKIVAVEKGFSKILLENEYVVFILEGKPDLIVADSDNKLMIIDHKSESRENDIFKYNNQFLGYCFASGTNNGIVNYIGLQEDSKNGDVLRREYFHFSEAMIEQWKNDTILWYYKILQAIVNKDFLRSYRCDSKYGNCVFTNLCMNPEMDGMIRQDHIKRLYNIKEPHRSY